MIAVPRSRSRPSRSNKPADFFLAERRGAFVDDQRFRIVRERLGDLHELLIGQREPPGQRIGFDVIDADLFEQIGYAAPQFASADLAERPGGFMREHDVFGHGQMRGQRQLLEHRGHAEFGGPDRVVELHRLARQSNRARVGRLHAAENLDQGALAGAVGAEENVDLAASTAEVRVVEGDGAGEVFGDAARFEGRRIVRRTGSG